MTNENEVRALSNEEIETVSGGNIVSVAKDLACSALDLISQVFGGVEAIHNVVATIDPLYYQH